MRAIASASPPLFPGPAKTTTGVDGGYSFVTACTKVFAARSMRSRLEIGSFSMVYLSSSCI